MSVYDSLDPEVIYIYIYIYIYDFFFKECEFGVGREPMLGYHFFWASNCKRR